MKHLLLILLAFTGLNLSPITTQAYETTSSSEKSIRVQPDFAFEKHVFADTVAIEIAPSGFKKLSGTLLNVIKKIAIDSNGLLDRPEIAVQFPTPVSQEQSTHSETPFWLGLYPKNFDLNKNISIQFDSYLEDPENAVDIKDLETVTIDLNSLNTFENADIQMVLSPTVLNRLVQLSYQRKVPGFLKLREDGHNFLLTTAPTLTEASDDWKAAYPEQPVVALNVRILVPYASLTTKERLAFKSSFEVRTQAMVLVKVNDVTQSVRLELIGANTDELSFDKSKLSNIGKALMKTAPQYLRSEMVKKIQKMAKGWRAEKKELDVDILLPTKELGLQTKTKKIEILKQGILLIHLDIEKGTAP